MKNSFLIISYISSIFVCLFLFLDKQGQCSGGSRNMASGGPSRPVVAECQESLSQQHKYKDTSVELEAKLSESFVDMVTTVNGKVSGLFLDGEISELKLNDFIVKELGLNARASELDWESLTPANKIHIIRYRAAHQITTFSERREVLGLRVKDSIEINIKQEISLFGERLKPGTHRIALGHLFEKIEFCCRGHQMKDLQIMELHFRWSHRTDHVHLTALVLAELLGLELVSTHTHVTGPIPFEVLREKPIEMSATIGVFYWAINLIGEIYDVVYTGGDLYEHRLDGDLLFGYFPPHRLQGVFEYLYQLGLGDRRPLGSQLKVGHFGFWGHDKYDVPDLFGAEMRISDPDVYPELIHVILRRVQSALNKHMFLRDEEVYQEWFSSKIEEQTESSASNILKGLSPHQEFGFLLNNAPARLKTKFNLTGWRGVMARRRLKSLYAGYSKRILIDGRKQTLQVTRAQVKWLLHDWSNTPLVSEDSDEAHQIEIAQEEALETLLNLNAAISAARGERPELSVDQAKEFVLYNTFCEFIEKSELLKRALALIDIHFEPKACS